MGTTQYGPAGRGGTAARRGDGTVGDTVRDTVRDTPGDTPGAVGGEA
jgi:hypothetical protein